MEQIEVKKKSRLKKVLLPLIIVLLLAGAAIGYFGYGYVLKPNVDLGGKKYTYLYIATGSGFEQVMDSLNADHILINPSSFEWVARQKNYTEKVKAGRYRIKDGMNNNALINMLRAGLQEPVKFTFNNARTKDDLISKLSGKLEADPNRLRALMNDDSYLEKYGFESENVVSMFIPNTYEMFWNTSADQLMDRMAKEYNKFWTPERKQKAAAMKLTPKQVSVLASIVQSETTKNDEKPRIAGVYMNRLQRDMPLEADPTLVFALGDFSIHRVLNKDKEIESPYNTYKYKGLPPGPICVPDVSSLDAVLNYEKHDYIYFCAKEDFSGYSNFASTYTEHVRNASRYQAALNKRKIMK